MSRNEKFTKFLEKNGIWLLVVAALISAYVILAFLQARILTEPQVNEKDIVRNYSDVVLKLNREPKKFTDQTYESAIPEFIQNDMRRVVDSESEISAIYNGTDCKIVISKDEQASNGVRIIFYDNDYPIGYVHQNISFYTDDQSIIVYGSWNRSRELEKYVMTKDGINKAEISNPYLDLYGTDVHFDDIRTFLQDSTLVRNENTFCFYYLGKQIGFTYRLPSGTVSEMDYGKIMNNNNDMFYMYYSSSVTNPWIVFSKVASKVDYVIDTNEEYFSIPISENQSFRYPIFVKNGKRYCGIPDLDTAIECSQDNGGCENNNSITEFSFDTEVVEISENTTFKIELDQSIDKNWYIVYWYGNDDRMGYMRERIYGLDSGLLSFIPKDRLEQFKKEISVTTIDSNVQELRELYDEYTPRNLTNKEL